MSDSGKSGSGSLSVRRIEGLVALPPSASEPAGTTRIEDMAEIQIKGLVKGGARNDLQTFVQAGWHFVADDRRGKKEKLRQVYRDKGGRLLIEGRQLTVRFAPETDDARITELLLSYGLAVSRRLGFAPKLYQVSRLEDVAPSGDIVELARRVSRNPEVLYAEPAFIEALGGRAGSVRAAG